MRSTLSIFPWPFSFLHSFKGYFFVTLALILQSEVKVFKTLIGVYSSDVSETLFLARFDELTKAPENFYSSFLLWAIGETI